MFPAFAPPARLTWRPDVGVSVEAIWKLNTASESPCASSVRSPEVTPSDDVDTYRPGVSVIPPRLPATGVAHRVRPAASLYAVVRSDSAVAAVGSPACWVPTSVPGGKPVTAVLGLTPRSPVTEVGPVFVTVEPASTAKFPAVPIATAAWLHAPVVNVHT